MNKVIYWFKALLRGHETAFVFQVSKSERDRLFALIQDEAVHQFAVFDTPDARVAVRLREVVFSQFLFDCGSIQSDTEAGADDWTVRVFFRGRQNAVELGMEPDPPEMDPDDARGTLRDLFFYLDSGGDDDERLMLADEDGEDAFLRRGDIALVCAPLSLFANSDEE